jgi:hypothetical protein
MAVVAPIWGQPLATTLAGLDEDSLLPLRLSLKDPVRRLDPATLSQFSVAVGQGQSRNLAEVLPPLMADQRRFAAQLDQVPAGVLLDRPEISEEILEFGDSFAILRRTRVNVVRPLELAKVSQEYARFLGQPKTGPVKLEPDSQAGFDRYLAHEVPRLSSQHPLRQAAQRGPEALLQAVVSGQGDFEIIDTYLIPRQTPMVKEGQILHPVLQGGVFDSTRTQAPRRLLFMPALGPSLATLVPLPARPEIVIPAGPQPMERLSGKHVSHVDFLTGFTRAGSWQFERRWNYPSGFFRMSLGMSYGLGLRVPLRITAETTPSEIEIRDREDRPVSMVTQISARTQDASTEFYRKLGLPERLLFDGQEAVLESSFYYGYKLNALWTDVIHQRRRDLGFDYSQNLAPPFADSNPSVRLAIPAALTQTEIRTAALRGYAQAAVRMDGKGTIEVNQEGLWNGRGLQRSHLTFSQLTPQQVVLQLPALVAQVGQQVQARYGFRLFDPAYRVDLTLTPEVRLGLEADFRVWSRNFRTDWMALNGLRVQLGELELGRHAGTPHEYRYEGGRKNFLATTRAGSSVADGPAQGSRLALRSLANGRYVRAGLDRLGHLGAASQQRRGWETFELERLGGDRVALRSGQNRLWVRAGGGQESYLMATSTRVDRWETFHLLALGQGRYALRSAQSQLYVGVRPDGLLNASSSTIQDAQIFQLELLP